MGDEEQLALTTGKKFGITEALLIYTSKIDVRDSVILKCMFGCQHYGKNLACPPNLPTAEQTRKIMGEYKKAMLLGGECKDAAEKKMFQQGLREIEKRFMQKDYYKALALMPGCCTECEQCSAVSGALCKNPLLRRPGLEGMGIDMISTLKKFKKNVKMKKEGEPVTYYGLVLLE